MALNVHLAITQAECGRKTSAPPWASKLSLRESPPLFRRVPGSAEAPAPTRCYSEPDAVVIRPHSQGMRRCPSSRDMDVVATSVPPCGLEMQTLHLFLRGRGMASPLAFFRAAEDANPGSVPPCGRGTTSPPWPFLHAAGDADGTDFPPHGRG
jgi:hypothetical protein